MGLVKAILALQHGVIPRNLHFTRLPDDVAQIETNLFVPQENTPWPINGNAPRRAAVSAYGFSGTNAHAIVEQAPETTEAAGQHDGTAQAATEPLLFPLSSTSADELRRTAGRIANWVQAHDNVALPDLAYTLARRRAHRPVRTTVIANNRQELIDALREVAEGDTPYQPAVGQDDRGRCGCFPGRVRSGPVWARSSWRPSRCSPPPSRRPSR
ncbi:mycocerosic acid synthase domain protein [Mycobacterium xenopi 3993]|nr:mycocerosic acid synthase domain protein [Mycobacterium xenopi 3993]